MRYISLFSGIGGLEHRDIRPVLACEIDLACREVLARRFPGVELHDDVNTLESPLADVVAGGWPCQDVTSAGRMSGIHSERSGLFFRMVDVAVRARAHTIVAENVPNLLYLRGGADFEVVLNTLRSAGFPFIAWRTLNAREFGLPQERRRLFIVASKQRSIAHAMHRDVPPDAARSCDECQTTEPQPRAAGFYWTAGSRGLCFNWGFAPALKIGAADDKGRSPVAVFFGTRVRKLTPTEALGLQGFRDDSLRGLPKTDLVRMAGNAVTLPVGQFVMDTVLEGVDGTWPIFRSGFAQITPHGLFESDAMWSVEHSERPVAANLERFVDKDLDESLSAQAAAGLLCRTVRAGHAMPLELFDTLLFLSQDRNQRLRGSRSNSFEMLDVMREEITDFRARLAERAECGEGGRQAMDAVRMSAMGAIRAASTSEIGGT